ncbi:UNVERIFIED_CONTAM: hypothetical protein HDU68_003220 [Siphonaria sp. JEL0065]|nr:hypothetical protein HDU68_003220 [Siphonaria sp. JEL0065]
MPNGPDLNRMGIFTEASYISSNEPYTGKKNGETNEPYTDLVVLRRRYRLQQKEKNIVTLPFKPSSVPPKPSGSGSQWGTIDQQYPLPNKGKNLELPPPLPKQKPESKPNFLTRPPKKGTGYGYANVTIGKSYDYMSEPYDSLLVVERKDRLESKKRMIGDRAFISSSARLDFFNAFAGLIGDGKAVPKSPPKKDKGHGSISNPFKPSSCCGYTINKYPSFELPSGLSSHNDKPPKKLVPIFRPSGISKSYPIRSIIEATCPIAAPKWLQEVIAHIKTLLAVVAALLASFLIISTINEYRKEIDSDLIQVQMLDYLNDELQTSSKTVFGGSLVKLWKPFNASHAIHQIVSASVQTVSQSYNRTDFAELFRRTRANLIAYKILYENSGLLKELMSKDNQWKTLLLSLVEDHTHTIYPWISPKFKSIRDMQQKFLKADQQDGIVFTTGQWHFELALHAILSLRDVLNATLPIEVYYAGPGDLNPNMIRSLNSIKGVTTVDIWDCFGEEATKISGWSIKPFAILASKFRNVIFVDADALFFQDPAILLKTSQLFKEYGQLFYHDRTIGSGDAKWFKSINKYPTNYAKTLRYMNRRSSHEMESGVVVVDKARAGVLHGLLLVCKMNSFDERAILYDEIHGDKESFNEIRDLTAQEKQIGAKYVNLYIDIKKMDMKLKIP